MMSMKKEVASRIFLVLVLGMLLFSMIGFVSAQEISGTIWYEKSWSWTISQVNKYIIPDYSRIPDIPVDWWTIISIFGLFIFYLIIYEIITTVSPLSNLVNIPLVIFVALILTISGIVRAVVGGLMVWIVTLTGAGGAFGMIMIGIIFLVGAWAIFTGSTRAHKWIARIRYNKDLQKKIGKAQRKAQDINALKELASDVESFK